MKSIFLRNVLFEAIFNTFSGKLFVCVVFILGNPFYSQAFAMAPKEGDRDTTKTRLVVNYHSNGRIKEKGYQGYYSNRLISTGAYVGTWNYYDPDGHLIQSVFYYNDLPSKAFIKKKTYYRNGKVKSIEKFNNYELYQSEVDSIGTWTYFDNNGKLIKNISYERKDTRHDN